MPFGLIFCSRKPYDDRKAPVVGRLEFFAMLSTAYAEYHKSSHYVVQGKKCWVGGNTAKVPAVSEGRKFLAEYVLQAG